MKAKLSERRVPMGETQRAVLALLREQGPKQRWQRSPMLAHLKRPNVAGNRLAEGKSG